MGEKKIGLLTAIALVIANMVGTGVFSSLGFQVTALPSVTVLLLLWLCGGLIALFGGMSYIQLAKLYPGSGGEYHYIKQAYPPIFAYFTGFTSILAGFAAPIALAAMAFGFYFTQLFPQLSVKWLAFLLINHVTFFHCFSIRLGSKFQLITTLIKLLLIIFLIVFGLMIKGNANPITFLPADLSLIKSHGFAISLVYVSFAYSGWNACVYIFNEIRNPEKNIRYAIIIGTLGVTLLYLLLNYVFLKTVPMAQLQNVIEIGAVSAKVIFGNDGGKIMALLISLLLISSISAMVWIGSRVIAKMIEKKQQPAPTAVGVKVPLKAIAIQYLITIALLLTETFQQILIYTGVLLCLSSCLAVAIIYFNYRKLKVRHFFAPTIFLIVNLYTMIVLLTS